MKRVLAFTVVVALVLATALCGQSCAQEEELPSSRGEISRALGELQEHYGMDAVRMQAYLLRFALGGGSIFEASAAVAGIEEHESRRYLRFDLVTGIVYDEATIAQKERPARIWIDVVDPALKNFTTIDVPADGILLHIVYEHAAYGDRAELLRKHRDEPPRSEEIHLLLSSGEIVEFANSRLTSADLLDHASVLLNGEPARIDLSGIAPAERVAPPTVPPLFPDEKP
jgi:hypothetical protein